MKKIKLQKGEVEIFDLGAIKLHAYQTNDPMNDEVLILQKGSEVVIIESPDFYENNIELENYLKELGVVSKGVLIAYHPTGATFLKNVKRYSTKEAENFANGASKIMVDNFSKAFGDAYDNHVNSITNYIKTPKLEIAGIKLNILKTAEAFDVEIPEINAVYTHMLGGDTHSIIEGAEAGKKMIKVLETFQKKRFNLILSSHHTPENQKAVSSKIAYLNDVLKIAQQSNSAFEMKNKVKEIYPNYKGEPYLEMSVNFFFKK
ncbi:MAG: hypothetical protein LBM99_06085 [Bacillales bacterium]|jgi:hypothetical protein|nr:hypothetical protein [Bacillales bacterium]